MEPAAPQQQQAKTQHTYLNALMQATRWRLIIDQAIIKSNQPQDLSMVPLQELAVASAIKGNKMHHSTSMHHLSSCPQPRPTQCNPAHPC
jgi:hypothetical protein